MDTTIAIAKIFCDQKNNQTLYKHYRKLRKASEVARYLEDGGGNATFFKKFMSYEKVRSLAIKSWLGGVVDEAQSFLTVTHAQDLKNAMELIVK